jgi:hypothetical protein
MSSLPPPPSSKEKLKSPRASNASMQGIYRVGHAMPCLEIEIKHSEKHTRDLNLGF